MGMLWMKTIFIHQTCFPLVALDRSQLGQRSRMIRGSVVGNWSNAVLQPTITNSKSTRRSRATRVILVWSVFYEFILKNGYFRKVFRVSDTPISYSFRVLAAGRCSSRVLSECKRHMWSSNVHSSINSFPAISLWTWRLPGPTEGGDRGCRHR